MIANNYNLYTHTHTLVIYVSVFLYGEIFCRFGGSEKSRGMKKTTTINKEQKAETGEK